MIFLSSILHQLVSNILIKFFLDHHESLKSEVGKIRLHNNFIDCFPNTETRERAYYRHSDRHVHISLPFSLNKLIQKRSLINQQKYARK